MLFENRVGGFLVMSMMLLPCGAGITCLEGSGSGRRVRSRACCWLDIIGGCRGSMVWLLACPLDKMQSFSTDLFTFG